MSDDAKTNPTGSSSPKMPSATATVSGEPPSHSQQRSRPQQRISLPVLLAFFFALPFTITVTIIGTIFWVTERETFRSLVAETQEETSNRVSEQLDAYLRVPHALNEINVAARELGILDLEDFETTGRYFWKQMQSFEEVGYVNYANQDEAEFIGVERLDDGTLLVIEIVSERPGQLRIYQTDSEGNRTSFEDEPDEADTREEGWYADAVRAGRPIWSEIYNWQDKPEILSISASYPIYDNGGDLPIGVIGVDLILSQIGDFLQSLDVSENTRILVIDREGYLVASSDPDEPLYRLSESTPGEMPEPERILARESENELTKNLLAAFDSASNLARAQQATLPLNNDRYLVQATPWRDRYGLDWSIVVALPESDFLAPVNRTRLITFIFVVSVSLVALGVGIAFARRLARPVRELSYVAEDITAGNLERRARTDNGTVETQTLARNFNNLVERVRELLARQQQETEKARLLAAIAQSGTDEEIVAPLNRYLADVRGQLDSDRLLVCRCQAGGNWDVVGESVANQWSSTLGTATLADLRLPPDLLVAYLQGRTEPSVELEPLSLPPETFAPAGSQSPPTLETPPRTERDSHVRSHIVIPIVTAGNLLGLLVAHQCDRERIWTPVESDRLVQEAEQLGIALSSIVLLEQQRAAAQEQRSRREELEREVAQLMSDMERAAEGDLTARARLMAGDIGILADMFNAIIEYLQATAKQVKTASVHVSHSLGENEGPVRELAEKAIAEAEEIRQTLVSVEQMTQSIRAVADNASQAAAIADAAFGSARQGNEVMERTVASILGLRTTVGDTAKKMKRLGESAQKISQVVSLIDEIALKTNLLAINASVEANRAGELGRGFTAVAEQVGALAEQSASAVKEIARVVADIQTETQEAIAAMEQGTAEVVDSTRLVEMTKQRLAEVLQKSQEIDNLMQSISRATVTQARTSESVAALMQQVTHASEERSASSRQVAAAIAATTQVAQALQASVERFQVEKEADANNGNFPNGDRPAEET